LTRTTFGRTWEGQKSWSMQGEWCWWPSRESDTLRFWVPKDLGTMLILWWKCTE
jgi:hypothetical protein